MKKLFLEGLVTLLSLIAIGDTKAGIGKMVNGQPVITVDAVEFENHLKIQLAQHEVINLKIDNVYFQMDETITDGIPDLVFVCTYQLPNDSSLHKISVLSDCELEENGDVIRITNGGAGTVTCTAKNCPDGCMVKRGGCPPPCPAPDPDAKIQPECIRASTSDGGSGLAKDLVKMALGYLLGTLTK
jgi:hypothetical protein